MGVFSAHLCLLCWDHVDGVRASSARMPRMDCIRHDANGNCYVSRHDRFYIRIAYRVQGIQLRRLRNQYIPSTTSARSLPRMLPSSKNIIPEPSSLSIIIEIQSLSTRNFHLIPPSPLLHAHSTSQAQQSNPQPPRTDHLHQLPRLGRDGRLSQQ